MGAVRGPGTAYARALAPFQFSDGDGPAASSDAQNVDFGVSVNPAQHFVPKTTQVGDDGSRVLNGTPEDRTSLFGVVVYPWDPLPRRKQKGVTVAGRLQKDGGVGSTVGAVRGAPLGRRGEFWTPCTVIGRPFGQPGNAAQAEDVVYTRLEGQL
jgi:hypothetical protein